MESATEATAIPAAAPEPEKAPRQRWWGKLLRSLVSRPVVIAILTVVLAIITGDGLAKAFPTMWPFNVLSQYPLAVKALAGLIPVVITVLREWKSQPKGESSKERKGRIVIIAPVIFLVSLSLNAGLALVITPLLPGPQAGDGTSSQANGGSSTGSGGPAARTTGATPTRGRTASGPSTTDSPSGAAAPAIPSSQVATSPSQTSTANQAASPSSPNLIKNPSFDQASGTGPTTVTGGAPGKAAGGPSAAASWSVYNNSNGGTTTTELVGSSGPVGGQMLHVCTSESLNEIDQYFAAQTGVGPDKALWRVWIYLVSGKVGVGVGNGGSTGVETSSTTLGQWELLQFQHSGSPATEMIIAGLAQNTCFYVDSASMQAAT